MQDQYQNYTVIGYGIGKKYQEIKSILGDEVKLHCVMDRRWEDTDDEVFDGIPIIRLAQLEKIKNPLVVIFPEFTSIRKEIRRILKTMDIDVVIRDAAEVFPVRYCIESEQLMALLPAHEYRDNRNNRIFFDDTIGYNIKVSLCGNCNTLYLGSNIATENLYIAMGNQSICKIGNGMTTMGDAQIHISNALIEIGEDCMFSCGTCLRAHDGHPIFDIQTGERINTGKNIQIGDHVWIGHGATILGGAKIGMGSIVGEKAVTASSFGENVVIAGNPARVIREGVIWGRDNTTFVTSEHIRESMDRRAKEYFIQLCNE